MKKINIVTLFSLLTVFSNCHFIYTQSVLPKAKSFPEPQIFELPPAKEETAKEELITQPFPPDEEITESAVPSDKAELPSIQNDIQKTSGQADITSNEKIDKSQNTETKTANESEVSQPEIIQSFPDVSNIGELPEEELSPIESPVEIEEKLEKIEEETEELPQTQPEPSRSVTIKKNQFLDVEYPGTGWICMGETEKETKLVSFGRGKLNQEKTFFTFRARNAGTTMLHFYKNDILTGSYIDDYLEVVIEDEETTSKEHLKAPSYEEIVPPEPNYALLKPAQKKSADADLSENATDISENDTSFPENNSINSNIQKSTQKISTKNQTQDAYTENSADSSSEHSGRTIIQTTTEQDTKQTVQTQKTVNQTDPQIKTHITEQNSPSNETQSASEILKLAQKAYEKADYEEALHLVMDFFEKSDLDLDKAIFLQGQILEEKSPVQDIKSAIDAYDVIIKNYRQSPLWKKANERSIYLKRFYINIR